jgi:Spy/CpxP family protein refolding chaperone
MKLALNATALAALLLVSTASAVAAQQPEAPPPGQRSGGQRQGRGPGRGAGPDNPGVSPGEVQRMFDAYALMQAQEQLKISDEQFAKFMPRFKALQEARRKTQADRTRIIIELRQLAAAASTDEAQIKAKLRSLQDADVQTADELRKSYETIDQVLNVKQQAQFRVFEEVMERRKLDMISRARANRPRPKSEQ